MLEIYAARQRTFPGENTFYSSSHQLMVKTGHWKKQFGILEMGGQSGGHILYIIQIYV